MTQHLQMWISIVALIATTLNILWSWVAQSRTAAASKLTEVANKVVALDAEVENHDRRIQAVESDLKHLPTSAEITALKMQLAEVVGHMRGFEADMANAVRTIRRFEDHLMGGTRA